MLFAALLAVITTAYAQDDDAPGNFGAGLSVGDTTGVSLGYRPTEWNAVQVGAGYDLLDTRLTGTADYLQSVAVIDPDPNIRIPVYIGLGAGIGRDRSPDGDRVPVAIGGEPDAETDISARVPVGASVLFLNAPVEFFGNVIPSVRVLPDRQFDVDGTVGFRYYF